jgi:hypothetical protein
MDDNLRTQSDRDDITSAAAAVRAWLEHTEANTLELRGTARGLALIVKQLVFLNDAALFDALRVFDVATETAFTATRLT